MTNQENIFKNTQLFRQEDAGQLVLAVKEEVCGGLYIGCCHIIYKCRIVHKVVHLVPGEKNVPHAGKPVSIALHICSMLLFKLRLYFLHVVFRRTFFFDQFYFHGPAKFFNGDTNVATYYNKQVYEYSDVDGLVDVQFVDADKLFTHLKPSWLKGLSLHSTLEWRPGNALIFDSVRLHCASDFRRLNIQSKLAISIFTRL